MNLIKSVTSLDFTAEVLDSPVPVLVDFDADWCGRLVQQASGVVPEAALRTALQRLSAVASESVG